MRNPLLAAFAAILLLNATLLAADRTEDSCGVSAAVGGSSFTDTTVGMEFVAVPGGCFRMGDSIGDGESDEKPVHEVCVDGFSMGKYPVTVGEFGRFVRATGFRTEAERGGGCFTVGSDWRWSKKSSANWQEPGFPQTGRHPVVCVSWDDAVEFSKWLTRQGGKKYRLPTEAEWEYAARGGTRGRNYWGDRWDDACAYADVNDRTAGRTRLTRVTTHDCEDGYLYTAPVGSFIPNSFGLYDMMGNAWQWTGDWYGKDYYAESPRNNPLGPPSGKQRVPRGGSWRSSVEHLRVSLRVHPPSPSAGVGFRLLSPVN
jgi:sulfatase modifying factor 1